MGYDPDLYLDFVQETCDLLKQTAANVATADGEQKLVASFNDEGISSSIITHFRVNIDPNAKMQNPFASSDTLTILPAHHKRLDEIKR